MSEIQPPTTTDQPAPATGAPVDRPSDGSVERRRPRFGVAIGVFLLLIVVAAIVFRGRTPTTAHYVGLSMALFVMGTVGVLIRRNALVMFMCVELMLNAVNIAFVAFARMHGSVEGHVVVLFVMIVAAAEVAIGLAIIVSIFRRRHSANVDDLSLLKW